MATEKSNDKATEKAQSDRSKALDTALAQIERQFGKGSVMKMSERQNQVVEVIPTGSIGLDIALGIGGLPRGRVVEIYGPESSGKTTLTLHAIANAQKAGGICADRLEDGKKMIPKNVELVAQVGKRKFAKIKVV